MSEPGSPSCPLPQEPSFVTLAHGGGGRLMHRLVREVFAQAFGCAADHDAAVEPRPAGRVATTTDAHVVRPLEFPGGDIGSLAVHGTVNDLACAGARPLSLAAAFVIEEGMPFEALRRIARSMAAAAEAAGVAVSTGDTKVVERGKADGLYIATSGLGVLEHELDIHPRSLRAGDALLVSGDLGRHGMAVMSARENLGFEGELVSDSQPVWPAVRALIEGGIELRCARDLTRGGLTSALVELAETSQLGLEVKEEALSVAPRVRAACELLGLDPLQVANEGRFVAIVPELQAERALELLRATPEAADAALAGRVLAERPGRAALRTRLGTLRELQMPSGEQLPRIC